jgi:DNA-binding transcriptional ArsR family regulator
LERRGRRRHHQTEDQQDAHDLHAFGDSQRHQDHEDRAEKARRHALGVGELGLKAGESQRPHDDGERASRTTPMASIAHNVDRRTPRTLPKSRVFACRRTSCRNSGTAGPVPATATVQCRSPVSEIAAAEGEKMTTVSARLQILHAARLIGRRREGKSVIYSIADDHVLMLVKNAVAHAVEKH